LDNDNAYEYLEMIKEPLKIMVKYKKESAELMKEVLIK
jgi:hypothetical protein